ncbi:hypothetical protein MBH78_03725 [Oceanimonas sp. NS1]|nr:hypothetical protein [Oceanimonas sp. NS1]
MVGLEQSCHDLRNRMEAVSQEEVEAVVSLAQDILRRLRRRVPNDDTLRKYYTNIDNYVSWFTEQRLLSLVAHLPRNGDYKTVKSLLLEVCAIERQHRIDNKYNTAHASDSLSRISNKMRLLRRLIEYPVTLKERTRELGVANRNCSRRWSPPW